MVAALHTVAVAERVGGQTAVPVRVVVVDDNPDVLLMARAAAASHGAVHVVGTATTADEAFEVVAELEPDVVALDVVLGTTDGLEILERLRSRSPDRPVVIMSALGEMVATEACDRGAASFVAKDGHFPDAFCAAVTSAVRREQLEERRFVGYHYLVATLGVATFLGLTATVRFPSRPGLAAGLAVAAGIAYRVPVSVVVQGRAERTIHLTAQVFVAALLLLPPAEAALAMSVGGAIGLWCQRFDAPRTAMGIGLICLQYVTGAAVVSALAAERVGWQVAAAAAGSAVAVLVNLAVFAPAAVIGNRVPLRRFLGDVGPTCALVWLGAAPVGAAAGLLGRQHLAAMGLMVGPQMLLLAWSAQHLRLQAEQRRVEVLLETSTKTHAARSVAEIEDIVIAAAAALVGTEQVRVTAERPSTGVCVPLDDGSGTRWLGAATGDDPRARQVLDALAATATAAMRQAAEHAADRSAARHDPATGLANAAMFGESLDRAVALADRDRTAVTVLYIDLDNFNPINDSFGHAAGDDVLRVVADRLRAEVRGCDLSARLGGDEFAVLLPGVGFDDSTVDAAARRVRAAVEAPITLAHGTVTVGASIGAATYPGEAITAAGLTAAADAAMYTDKHQRSTADGSPSGSRSGRGGT